MTFASIQTLEKIPRAITLTARGTAGHGSVPLRSNAVVKLSDGGRRRWPSGSRRSASTRRPRRTSSGWRPSPIPAAADRYRAILGTDPKAQDAADEYFLDNEPRHASTIRTSISPTMIQAGYRTNVIPSEVKATLDVRMMPDQDPAAFLEMVKKVVNDPAVEVTYGARDVRPGGTSRLNTDAFAAIEANIKKHYDVITLPAMSTGATDMAYLRAKGIQCYGVGPAIDIEDGPKGFGAHSDQERINESELYRFVALLLRHRRDLARATAGGHAGEPTPAARPTAGWRSPVSGWAPARRAARRPPRRPRRRRAGRWCSCRWCGVGYDRVIRHTVGLRPHRPSGFVLRAGKLDAKTVIHNYGHGGSGHVAVVGHRRRWPPTWRWPTASGAPPCSAAAWSG